MATICEDGTYSPSTGPGTCSWHGGIAGNDHSSGGRSTGYTASTRAAKPVKCPEPAAEFGGLHLILVGVGVVAGWFVRECME